MTSARSTKRSGPQFVAFAISFAVIANFWLVHHRMIASFAAIDYPVIVANLGLIAAVVLLPFSTEAVGDPNTEDLALPTVVLAIDVAVASALCGLVYWLARKRDLLDPKPSEQAARANLTASLVPAAVFLASIPIAYLASPEAAQISWLSLLLLGRFMHPGGEQERKGR